MSHSKRKRLHNKTKQPALNTNGRKSRSYVWWILAGVGAVAWTWAAYVFFVQPFGFRWRALFGDPSYPKGYEIHGIDISHHQGDIDWIKLRNAMIDKTYLRFVMVKATEGSDYIDECFEKNFREARNAGFIRGAYHYWSVLSTAREQASFFLDKVNLEAGDLPPVLDVEQKPNDMSVEEFQLEILAWLHIVEDRYQCKPIIYTYYKFKENFLSDSRFDDYPYWIAHYYVEEVQYQGKWKFWQHTDVGKLPGIKGFVDLDIYNGSYYDLEQLTIRQEQIDEPDFTTGDSINYEMNDSDAQSSSTELD